jgi:hypothetical protein
MYLHPDQLARLSFVWYKYINSLKMCQLLLGRSKKDLSIGAIPHIKGNLPNIFNFAPDPFQISSKNTRKMFIYIYKSAMLWCT